MPEIPRDRDCYVLYRGTTLTVSIPDSLAVAGWPGGQGVMFVPPAGDDLRVDIADGRYAGFALWGSDEISDQLTAMTRSQIAYKFMVIGVSGWIIATTTFEKYTFASRQGSGPLVPIDYHASDRLVFSLRGLWTKEDEWTLSGDPRAPNTFYIGFVVQRPTPQRKDYLTIQVSI